MEVTMLELFNPEAEVFFPDEIKTDLAKTTHLGIGAHQDDLEIFAIHGILEAYNASQQFFSGVTVTDGRGAPRSGPYAGMSDDDLWKVRVQEQKKAALIGKYLAQILLNYPSKQIKTYPRDNLIKDLTSIFTAVSPKVIYTHNLADKHETHVAVALAVIEALRGLDPPIEGLKLYGCEVWRGLDWLPDEDKIAFDVSHHTNLQKALISVFKSQIAGGKRYDLATMGRRRANATYYHSHSTDTASQMVYAMDLTPLVDNPSMAIDRFIVSAIQSFADDVARRVNLLGKDHS
jgi:LmbE family N-acetylglucosaminyl deacetylase